MRARDIATERDDEEGVEAPRAPVLVVHCCPDATVAGRTIPLPDRLRIGRSGEADIDLPIDDSKLSRSHAVIATRIDATRWRLEDQGSTNGSFVAGLRVRARDLGVGDVLRVGETVLELARDAPRAPDVADDAELVGRSAPLRALLAEVDRVAPTLISVLVSGPTGAGKELVARRLHARSRRRGPLVAVNCGAIAPTLVEAALFGHRKGAFTDATADSLGFFGQAAGGTLFLDEIGVLLPGLQPKLLRVLEAREYTPVGTAASLPADVRVVSATNIDLFAEVAAGRFRRDLYARLAEEVIAVPSLHERRADIPLLVSHLLASMAPGRSFTMSATFLETLLLYDFPMNVRELRAAVQHALLVATGEKELRTRHLPQPLRRPDAPAPSPDEDEAPSRADLEAVLARSRGNLARVADHYGKARMQIYRWLRKHKLTAEDYR